MRRGHSAFVTMSPEETTFYRNLGLRIAALRNDRGLTQAQLAETLGVSQQQMLSFEKGRRRIAVATLPKLARALGVSIEELVGAGSRPGKRGPAPRLQHQLERLQQLPRSKQRFVSEFIDTILQQAGA